MSIPTTCPYCHRKYVVPNRHEGKKFSCRNCGKYIVVQWDDDVPLGTSTRSLRTDGDVISSSDMISAEIDAPSPEATSVDDDASTFGLSVPIDENGSEENDTAADDVDSPFVKRLSRTSFAELESGEALPPAQVETKPPKNAAKKKRRKKKPAQEDILPGLSATMESSRPKIGRRDDILFYGILGVLALAVGIPLLNEAMPSLFGGEQVANVSEVKAPEQPVERRPPNIRDQPPRPPVANRPVKNAPQQPAADVINVQAAPRRPAVNQVIYVVDSPTSETQAPSPDWTPPAAATRPDEPSNKNTFPIGF